jgi:protocatechuate 3,4-dioxygenase beta subunit
MLNKLLLVTLVIFVQAVGNPPAPPVPPVPGITVGPVFIGPDGNFGQPFVANSPAQQQLPPGTATVEGIVTILGSNDPVAGAIVEMRKAECGRTGGESMTATSGPDGRFSFKQVRAGNWCVGAARIGGALAPAEYRQRGYKSRGMTIPIADNQQVQDVRLAMPRTGNISGRVLDSDGEPMGHARVQAMEAIYQNGKKRLYTLNVVQTNDLGEFSLYWLPPGEYYVSAVPEDPSRQNVMFSVSPPGIGGHRSDAMPPVVTRKNLPDGSFTEEVYRPIYYGGGTDPQRAQKIDVRPGSANSIELSFAGAHTQAFHIRGRAMNGVTGQPAEGAQIRLYPLDWTATAVVPYARVDKAGNFDIKGVAPGSYAIYAAASTRDPNAPNPANLQGVPPAQLEQLIAQGVNIGGGIPIGVRFPVEMGSQHLENVSLNLLPGGALLGDFIFEGNLATTLTAQQKSSFRVSLARHPDIPGLSLGGASAGNIPNNAADTSFRLPSIFPGDFRVMVSPLLNPFSWTPQTLADPLSNIFVKSVRYGSADVLNDGLRLESHNPDQRLQIVLSTGGRLEGVVTSDRGEPLPNVKVALVPDFAYRSREELYRNAVTDTSGRFRIQGIAAGDYRAFAWEDIADGAWQDADILRGVESRGKPVRIGEAGQTAVELVAIPGGAR